MSGPMAGAGGRSRGGGAQPTPGPATVGAPGVTASGDDITVTATGLTFGFDGVAALPIQSILVTGTRTSWRDREFVNHYYYGDGTTIDLRDVGLGDVIRNSPPVRSAVRGFVTGLFIQQPTVLVTYRASLDLTSDIYSVGNTSFYAQGMCHGGTCFYRAGITDWFRDPLGLGRELPGGTPYRIVYEWGENLPVPSWVR